MPSDEERIKQRWRDRYHLTVAQIKQKWQEFLEVEGLKSRLEERADLNEADREAMIGAFERKQQSRR